MVKMNKLVVTSILIAVAFCFSLFLITPRVKAVALDAELFQHEHINPTINMVFDYTAPLKGDNVSHRAAFHITFPTMQLKSAQEETPFHHVESFMDDSPASILDWEYEYGKFQKVEHWYDGTVTREPMDKTGLEEKYADGNYYEGWFPSPAQLADYICYEKGWTLNYIVSAERAYECQDEGEIVDMVTEFEHENFIVDSDYEDPDGLYIYQAGAKTLPLPGESKQVKGQLAMEITQKNDSTKQWTALIALIALLVITFWTLPTVCDAWIATDTTPYGVEDLADAYGDGWNQGVDETIDEYERRLANLLINGTISNESYSLLKNEVDGTYDTVMANYVNPYEDLTIGGGANSWVHTIIWLVVAGIIILVIILIVIYLLPVILHRIRGKIKKKD